jgi:predicted dehydrogenase
MEMVKHEHLDIVSVATPVETHCKIVCDIAPFVKGVYVEKPIAETVEDATKMIDTCHKYGVVLQVNHQRDWNTPVFRFSRGLLHTGTHAFALVNKYFKDPTCVKFEYIDTQERIFELDFPAVPHVPVKAVEYLIDCIENKRESNANEARKALALCLNLSKTLSEAKS